MNLTQEQIKRRDEFVNKQSTDMFGKKYDEFRNLDHFCRLGYEAGLSEAQVLVSALELIGDDEVWEKNNICPHEEAREALAKFRGEK